MSQTLKKLSPYLRVLQKSSPNVQRALVKKHCSPEFIKCICECAKNVLVGNVVLSAVHKKRLKRYKQSLRRLALKKTSLKIKKKIVQSGGFLGALLGPIVKVLGGLFGAN
jgi:predicted ATP-grasp superfamily ATP-dependent carboligase